MVLDGKGGGGHNDYGSIGLGSGGGGGLGLDPRTRDNEGGPSPNNNNITNNTAPTNNCTITMSNNDQRLPLLPQETDTATTHFYEEEDEPPKHEDNGICKMVSANGGLVAISVTQPIRDKSRFPKEKWKTFIAFLILTVNFIVTTVSLATVHERVPSYAPLPDIILDHITPLEWALDASEIIIMISTNITFLVILSHKHRWIVFRRVCLLLSVLYLMRSITMFVTVLPKSSTSYYCSPKANSTNPILISKRVFQLISGFGLSINGKHTYCGDFIYSGHTVILTMCYLLVSEYSSKRLIYLHWAQWIASFAGVVLVLLARGHYTVDVIIAYYATTRIFWMYHTLANNAILQQPASTNLLTRLWWYKFFLYFERNVGGPVPRHYNWPLPWPRRFHAKHPIHDS